MPTNDSPTTGSATRRRFARLTAGLVAGGLLLSACGSSGDDEPAASTPTTSQPAASTGGASPAGWPLQNVTPKLPATITDANGAKVTITNIDRIASLQGDISEVLWALGLGERIAVGDTTTTFIKGLNEVPDVGWYRGISAEGVLAQRPSVVFLHDVAGPTPAIEAIRASGVPMVVLPEMNGGDLAQVGAKIRLVADAVGLHDEGVKVAAEVQREMDEASALAATAKQKPLVAVVTPRGDSVFLLGTDSGSNALLRAAGARTVADELGLDRSVPLTPEALAAADPDFVLTSLSALRTGGGRTAFLAKPGLAETTAAKNGNLLAYDDLLILQYGPRAGQAIAELARKIHPELAAK